MQPLNTALIQFNPTVGALEQNADRIVELASAAAVDGAQLIVFPELSLCGYPPEDLILRPHFIQDCAKQLDRIAGKLPAEAYCVIGSPIERHNAAVVFHKGKQIGIYRKMMLPNYGVFDEKRVFDEGDSPFAFDAFGTKVGIHICEDSWLADGEASTSLAAEKPDLVINLSASPYHRGKRFEREEVFAAAARAMNAPLLFCNQVGGQDELVFDGGSAAFEADGTLVASAPLFKEGTLTAGTGVFQSLEPLEEVYEALKTGLRDYVEKNGFKKTVVAVSGGIDSALVLAIAVDALGKDRVAAITMPSQYSSSETLSDAEQIAANFGVEFHTIPIFPIFEKFTEELSIHWNPEPGLAEENLQARIRGTLIMAMSNKNGWLVLSTGNKSEYATGYCTLYGDMAGGFAVIKDVPKTLVFELSRWRNTQSEKPAIPPSTIERPPSAELRPDQQDTDSLPPYEVLDPILEAYVEKDMGIDAMLAAGFDEAAVRQAVRLTDLSEYKRRQGPPGIKITPKAFGRDRRMPVTNRYRG
ncbi:NAD+ synthase [Tichowtungia aerotolerans]|uniref:Glutamine-dependent NAD(+) synthetase n=1 Tax=Tichowtungia aerotolerans TaxID=2697043 RepID=A0A6P1M4P2_9BACT|nr:NAD+ synthase [Tichowtungia aerotolerans]QHI69560.1 NAD+ synthase [Tichowtungia aerotolerans]